MERITGSMHYSSGLAEAKASSVVLRDNITISMDFKGLMACLGAHVGKGCKRGRKPKSAMQA